MEELRDTPLKEKFRFLLIHIGNELHTRNCKALKFGHQIHISRRDQDEEGLDILSELMKKGKFDAYSPEKLQKILEMIDRKDLADIVKEYRKSSLFKDEMRRRKKMNDSKPSRAEELSHHSHLYEDPLSARHMEKCWNALAKTLTHMTAMLEQTTSLVSSVEVFMNDDSKKKEAQASIAETKSKMEELSKAIRETATEIESTKDHQLDDTHWKKTEGCTRKDKLVTDVRRARSNSDVVPKHAYISLESPTMKLKPLARGKQAVMMIWSEISHKKEQHRRGSSRSRRSSGSSITSTSSNEDKSSEERYESAGTAGTIKKDHEQDEGSASTPGVLDSPDDHVYDDPDSTDRKPQMRWYVNIPLLPLQGEEHAKTQAETPDSPHCCENFTL